MLNSEWGVHENFAFLKMEWGVHTSTPHCFQIHACCFQFHTPSLPILHPRCCKFCTQLFPILCPAVSNSMPCCFQFCTLLFPIFHPTVSNSTPHCFQFCAPTVSNSAPQFFQFCTLLFLIICPIPLFRFKFHTLLFQILYRQLSSLPSATSNSMFPEAKSYTMTTLSTITNKLGHNP